MDGSIQADIQLFLGEIISKDMRPPEALLGHQSWRLACGAFLKKPLPFDTCSSSTMSLMPQLLDNIGNDDNIVYTSSIVSSACGDVKAAQIFAATAASGMGKTHLAYAVGRKNIYSLIIRVAEQGESGGAPRMSLPWQRLINFLTPFDAMLLTLTDQAQTDVLTQDACKLVELLVLCYVDVTVCALEYALFISPAIEPQHIHEVILRFHRNDGAEQLIEQHFQAETLRMQCDSCLYECCSDVKTMKVVSSEMLAEYRERLSKRTDALPPPRHATGTQLPRLLICLDEVSAS
jgi:hypothetical protein